EDDLENTVLLVLLEQDVGVRLPQGLDEVEEAGLVRERLRVLDLSPQEPLRERPRDPALLHPVEELRDRDHPLEEAPELRSLELLAGGEADLAVLHRALHQELVEGVLVLEVGLGLAVLGLVERRLRDVEVAALDELLHLPVEEGEEQRADVAAVHVRVA